jgi:iron complex outermembrane receptor protein
VRFSRSGLPGLAAGGVLCIAAPGWAEPAHIFRLPAEPVDAALLRFGVQAGVSIGGFPTPGCTGTSRAVSGVLTPSAALRRLLPPGCSFERVDTRAYRVVAAARTAPPPRPAEPATTTTTDVAELVVTAEKRREPLRGSPFAVSALSGTEIQRLGAHTFADAAAQFPGVAETNLGPGRNKIFIRGISDGVFTGRTQSTVGLYLDDIPITYNAPDPDLRLADLERVEVLRGPQGALYGSGSIGGIVRLVTARPDPAAAAAQIALEAMRNDPGDRSFGAEAMVNLPLAGGHAAIRGVAYIDELVGYLDNPGLGLKDVNHGRRSGGRVSGMAELPGGWQAHATLLRQGIKTDDSQYVPGSGIDRDTRIREPHDNDFTQVALGLGHSGSTADLRVSAAYIDHDLSTRYDATGAFDIAPGAVAGFDDDQRVELWVAEATAASAGQQRLRWFVGAFGSRTRETSAGALDARQSGGAMRSVFFRRDHLTEGALFGELTYDLTPQLTATLGGRLFATRVETNARGFDLARVPVVSPEGEDTDHGFAPKLRLAYAFAPDSVLYIQAQDGYRAGGFNVPAAADGVPGGPDVRAFKPDRLRSYEIGGEAVLFDRTLTVRAALFRADWHDVQTDQFRASGLPVTLNIGDGSNKGLEVEVGWRPDGHWRLRLNGLLDEPELVRESNIFPARVDIGLPGVARRSGSVDLVYRHALPGGLQGELGGQAAYIGRSFLTFDGASASAMGGYGQARISASVRGEGWQAQAYVANLTDARGDTFAFGNPFSRARASQATPLPPRTFGLAIRRAF